MTLTRGMTSKQSKVTLKPILMLLETAGRQDPLAGILNSMQQQIHVKKMHNEKISRTIIALTSRVIYSKVSFKVRK